MNRDTFRLASERLFLRCANIDDAAFFFELMNSEGWLDGIGDRGISDLAAAEKHIEHTVIRKYEEHGFDLFVVAAKDTPNIPLGLCGLIDRPELEDVDIGFAFLAKAGGLGYAAEAAQTVMDFARNDLKLTNVVAITSQTNWRSARVLEAIGLSYEKDILFGDSEEMVRLFA